jgi:transcriptional regulator with XRE-family HTH domain
MNEFELDTSFGEFLTNIMRERGFSSDEQLARRAMQVQEQFSQRVNIERRTINNWRNDRSVPRSASDQKFKLVMMALKLSEKEIAMMEAFIDGSIAQATVNSEPSEEKLSNPITPAEKLYSFWKVGAGGAFVLICAVISFFYLTPETSTPKTFRLSIPKEQLNLSADGFVLPNSDHKLLLLSDLETLTGWELYVARNEIYARHGRTFVKGSSICLQNHFDSWSKTSVREQGWYQKSINNIQLNDLEIRNAEIIRTYECNVRSGQYTCSGEAIPC